PTPPPPTPTPPPPTPTPPPPAPTPSPAPSPSSSAGTISFHLLLGVSGYGNPQDSLALAGDNYTDLVMSNLLAGVMVGHLVQRYTPGQQFEKDYLYGSVLGQLLQENLATQYYTAGSDLIDPNPNQQAVMGTGQGGPYQINNYAVDMVGGTYAPAGHSLINFVALQPNIGYTMANASTQYQRPTPASFNDKYYGPMLAAYFHFNDYVALNQIGKGAGGWTTPWQPQYDAAIANFTHLPGNFLEMLLNAAYNQGYYGGLVAHYSALGATATASTVASVDAWSNVWGDSNTYDQYPYQVRYYLNQFYDLPVPTTSATTLVTPSNHLAFPMATLRTVFSNTMQKMAYAPNATTYRLFTAAQAQAAFSAALSANGVAATATLDLANASDRARIFAVLESAIGQIESITGSHFDATTLSQLSPG
ncbi:MAG TPA: chitin-binding protein, partial [Burkholderiaceae bacterium]